MAETVDIAKIASKVSDDLFHHLGWERRPPRDRNWECVTEKHKKTTHPSDVVFSYDDPVDHSTIYFTTDLKSYAKASITVAQVKGALKSLSLSTECAAKSNQWRKLYINTAQNFKVHGLLFVYNHDGAFDQDFGSFIKDISSGSMSLRRWVKTFTLGPKEINYLLTIVNDMRTKRGDGILPSVDKCSYFYPDLVRVRVKSNYCRAATIEGLTGPWQVLRYEQGGHDKNESGFFFYYAGVGSTAEEFKYIFDYLFRHQLVRPEESISIRLAAGCKEAQLNFEHAKEQYVMDFFPYVPVDDTKRRLETISFERITTVVQSFSDIDLGME